MRWTRLLVCALTALLVLASMAAPTYAGRKPVPDDPNLILARMGFTQEQVNLLTPEAAERIVKLFGGTGAKLVGFRSNSVPMEDTEPGKDGGEVKPDGTIDTNDLDINAAVVSIPNPPDNQERFYVQTSWKWKNNPFWKLTDKVAMAWGGPLVLDQTTPRSVYFAYHCLGKKEFTNSYPSDQDIKAGVAFQVDLKSHIGLCPVTQHTGYIEGYIYKYWNATDEYPDMVLPVYFHQVKSVSGSISFSKSGPSVSISPTSGWDKSQALGTNYKYHGK